MPLEPQPPLGNYWQTWAGVNNTQVDTELANDELSDAANYEPDLSGTGFYIKRLGLTQSSSVKTATSYSIFDGKLANYWHNGTVIYDFSGAQLDTGFAAAADDWCSFGALDILVNGTDAQSTSDGATFNAATGVPSGAKYIAAINNFLYCAGHDKGKLRWADLGTATSWPATNELVLTQDENDDIVGIRPLANSLGVWSQKSHFMVTGYSTVSQEVSFYSPHEGAIGFRSINVNPFGAFWWTKSGLCWMKAPGALDYPMLRKLAATLNNLNRAYDASIHFVYDPNNQRLMMYLFNGASQTTVNLRVDYYPAYDAFYLHTGAGVAMAASGAATISGATAVYVGGYASSTYLYKVAGATDDGTNISAFIETKREGARSVLKRGRKVNLSTYLGTSGDVTYSCYLDAETSVQSGNSWTVTPATGPVDTKIGHNREHYRIKHRIADSLATRSEIVGLTHDGYVVRTV